MIKNKLIHRFALLLVLGLILSACATRAPVPVGTIPQATSVEGEDLAYGKEVLYQLQKKYSVNHEQAYNSRVQRVVRRLAEAAQASTYPWNIYVLNGDDVVNAAATRGNYVFVWTGLLKLATTDDQLATVLGHEIGHVLAHHTQPTPAEEANSMIAGVAGQAAYSTIGGTAGAMGGQLASLLAQALLVNPGSQRMELEADHIGLFMLAKAGYNPDEAIVFWKKMQFQTGDSGSLAFLSTHPPSSERIQELEKLLPRARSNNPYSDSADSFSRNFDSREDSFTREANDNVPSFDRQQDSFDINQGQPTGEYWEVVEDWAAVYFEPSLNARLKTHLFHGQKVEVEHSRAGWLKLRKPVEGYAEGVNFSPVRGASR